MIVIVFGLPGSGKSYFAERLAEKLEARRLSTDTIRKARFPDAGYSEREKMHVYGMLVQSVRLQTKSNANIVVDGTFYKSEIRDTFSWTADKLGDELKFIEVQADEKIIKKRTSRPRSGTDADFDVYLKVKDAFEPMDDQHLVLESTNSNIDEMLDEAIQYLENHKIHSF